MIQWATVLFYFFVEEVLISSVFPSMGVQKSSMLGFSYFTEGALLISPGRVNVPADFDTIEKAFSGVKTAEKA